MLIGQAPSLTDVRTGEMYSGPAGVKLRGWLSEAGFTDADWGTKIYPAALTKCFPGRLPGKSTDRAPSPRERALCRPWLDRQIALVDPIVILLFGKLAIDTFLGVGAMGDRIGDVFKWQGRVCIPLPHSSGASTWLNAAEHRALLAKAISEVGLYKAQVNTTSGMGDGLP